MAIENRVSKSLIEGKHKTNVKINSDFTTKVAPPPLPRPKERLYTKVEMESCFKEGIYFGYETFSEGIEDNDLIKCAQKRFEDFLKTL